MVWGWQDWSTSTGGEITECPFSGAVHCGYTRFVPFCCLCGLTKYTVVGAALSPTLIVGMLAVGHADFSSVVFTGPPTLIHWAQAPGLQCYLPGPSVGAMETVQTLAWPSPHVDMSRKPTATKARPIPAAGSLVTLSDVSQALNLGSGQQRYNSMVCAATRFQLFFISHRTLRAQLLLRPHLCVYSSQWVCSRGCQSTPAHQAGRAQGCDWGAQVGWFLGMVGMHKLIRWWAGQVSPRLGWSWWWQGHIRQLQEEPSLVSVEARACAWGKKLQWEPRPLHITQ